MTDQKNKIVKEELSIQDINKMMSKIRMLINELGHWVDINENAFATLKNLVKVYKQLQKLKTKKKK